MSQKKYTRDHIAKCISANSEKLNHWAEELTTSESELRDLLRELKEVEANMVGDYLCNYHSDERTARYHEINDEIGRVRMKQSEARFEFGKLLEGGK